MSKIRRTLPEYYTGRESVSFFEALSPEHKNLRYIGRTTTGLALTLTPDPDPSVSKRKSLIPGVAPEVRLPTLALRFSFRITRDLVIL
jgi:hypothetical protein